MLSDTNLGQISGAELAATVKHFVTVNDQLSKGEFVDKNAKKPRKVAEFL
jgi:hypothetical protein